MEHRSLGTHRGQVSPLCLGAMMFGAWGNTDHDESHPDHPPRRSTPASTSSTPPTSTRAASPRRSSARRSRAAGATTSCSPPRSTARWATTPTSSATRAAGSSARSRTACAGWAPTGSTSTRSTAPSRTPTSTRRSARSSDLVRAGQGPLHRLLDVPAERDRRGAVGRRAPRPRALRAASSRRTRCSSAASRPTCCPTCQRYGMGVIPWSPLAGGWLSGRYRIDGEDVETSRRAAMIPERYDMSMPENQRKLEAADALAQLAEEAGHPLIAAGARVRHPAPGRDLGDHRPAHHGAPRVAARRPPTSTLSRRRARPHRRDRARRAPTSTRPTPAGTARTSGSQARRRRPSCSAAWPDQPDK